MTNNITGWGLIPPYIMASKDLKANEKLLYGRILGLTNKHGYCWASNYWLGLQIGIEEQTVANIIWSFKKKGLIETKVFRDDKNKITKRHIFVPGFPIQGTGVPQIGNSSSSNEESYSVENRVEFSRENTIGLNTSDKQTTTVSPPSFLNEVLSKRAEKSSKKKAGFSSFNSYPKKTVVLAEPKKLSQQDVYEIAHELSISTLDVKSVQKQVLLAFKTGDAEKYNITSIHDTVMKWCLNGINKRQIDVLTTWMEKDDQIEDWSPETIQKRLDTFQKALDSGFWTQEEYDKTALPLKKLLEE
jgi:hypothetical protein